MQRPRCHRRRAASALPARRVLPPLLPPLCLPPTQPFFVNSPLGIYMIHNGNLTNCDQLRTLLNSSSSFFNRHLRTDSDSEVGPSCARLLAVCLCCVWSWWLVFVMLPVAMVGGVRCQAGHEER